MGKEEKKYQVQGKCYTREELSNSGLPSDVLDFVESYLRGADIEVKTSGSTGEPKKIVLQADHMKASAQASLKYFGLKPNDSCLVCMSAKYIAGMMMLVRWMEGELDLYFTPPTSNPLQDFNRKFSFVAMVPYQVYHSINHLDQVRILLIGGGAVAPDLLNKLKGAESRVFQSYGMTETITHIALRAISLHFQQNFKALPGVKLHVDEHSCLIITAPHIGVQNLQTKDVVSLETPNEFKWLGRLDNVVNSAGIKFYPEELEAKLGALEVAYFIGGTRDLALGQKLILIAETTDQNTLDRIQKSLEILDRYERPKELVGLSKFDRTDSGKIRRASIINRLFPES